MRNALTGALLAAALACSPALAEDHEHMDHRLHMQAGEADGRQPLAYPPELRQRVLADMRDHLDALSEILAALGGGRYAEAAHIARARLGTDSPAAGGCREEAKDGKMPDMAAADGMQRLLAHLMPDGMRRIGQEMHASAGEFADAAEAAAGTGQAGAAYAALARVSGKCVACHSAYRLP